MGAGDRWSLSTVSLNIGMGFRYRQIVKCIFCVHIRKQIGFAYLLGLCQMVLGGASTADDPTREGGVVDSWILEMWCASLTQARPRVWWPVSGARVHARAVAFSSHSNFGV